MKVFLLKAEVDKSQCLAKAQDVVDGLIGNEHAARIMPGLADSDLFICDIQALPAACGSELRKNNHHLLNRVRGGAVLLCFAGVPQLHNYDWLDAMGFRLDPEKLIAGNVRFVDDFPFSRVLQKNATDFKHQAIFNRAPEGYMRPLAYNKSNNLIAVYGKVEGGHVFILPQPQDLNHFVEHFIEEVIPMLGVDFLLQDGSIEPMPEDIKSLQVSGQTELMSKISKEQKKIDEAAEEKVVLEAQLKALESWKDLLWQTGTPLEDIVKRFFEEIFGLSLTKAVTDLVGEYDGKELFIEVKGNTGVINHKSDFRQIHERKFYEAKDPQNTIALLVGNPYRLLPLDQRPPSIDETIFAKTSIPVAESSGIGLIHTKEMFEIVNDTLSNPKLKKEKILESLMNAKGIYRYGEKRPN